MYLAQSNFNVQMCISCFTVTSSPVKPTGTSWCWMGWSSAPRETSSPTRRWSQTSPCAATHPPRRYSHGVIVRDCCRIAAHPACFPSFAGADHWRWRWRRAEGSREEFPGGVCCSVWDRRGRRNDTDKDPLLLSSGGGGCMRFIAISVSYP